MGKQALNRAKGPKPYNLPIDWRFSAEAAARNLGYTAPLHNLAAEHWQKVLNSVEAKMRLKGAAFPDGWQASLAEEVGRTDQ